MWSRQRHQAQICLDSASALEEVADVRKHLMEVRTGGLHTPAVVTGLALSQSEKNIWDWNGFCPTTKWVSTRVWGQGGKDGSGLVPLYRDSEHQSSFPGCGPQEETLPGGTTDTKGKCLDKIGEGEQSQETLEWKSRVSQYYIKINAQKFCEVRRGILNFTPPFLSALKLISPKNK